MSSHTTLTNEVEWIPVHGTTSDLSHVEEVSAPVLCNLVLHVPDEGAKRLDQSGEHRDTEGGVGEASSAEVPHEEGLEDESMQEDIGEDTDDEDVDEESESPNSSGSMQESLHSTCHYSDRHCHPHSWAELSKSGNWEGGSLGGSPKIRTVKVRGRAKRGIHQPPDILPAM